MWCSILPRAACRSRRHCARQSVTSASCCMLSCASLPPKSMARPCASSLQVGAAKFAPGAFACQPRGCCACAMAAPCRRSMPGWIIVRCCRACRRWRRRAVPSCLQAAPGIHARPRCSAIASMCAFRAGKGWSYLAGSLPSTCLGRRARRRVSLACGPTLRPQHRGCLRATIGRALNSTMLPMALTSWPGRGSCVSIASSAWVPSLCACALIFRRRSMPSLAWLRLTCTTVRATSRVTARALAPIPSPSSRWLPAPYPPALACPRSLIWVSRCCACHSSVPLRSAMRCCTTGGAMGCWSTTRAATGRRV